MGLAFLVLIRGLTMQYWLFLFFKRRGLNMFVVLGVWFVVCFLSFVILMCRCFILVCSFIVVMSLSVVICLIVIYCAVYVFTTLH